MDWPDLFSFSEKGYVSLQQHLRTYGQRSAAIEGVLSALFAAKEHPYLMNELYPVTARTREEALFEIDRSAAALFGLRTFAQHVNGIVRKHDGLYMWLGRRAVDKGTFPGMLDQLVAGGLPVAENFQSNLNKECSEEADIGIELAQAAVPVGALSYNIDNERGYKYDTLYCYDLELPEDFTPRCTDGEVSEFMLLPIAEVQQIVLETDDFKPNCNLVVIDFLLRHGMITPEHDEYLDLLTGLRPPMHVPRQVKQHDLTHPQSHINT